MSLRDYLSYHQAFMLIVKLFCVVIVILTKQNVIDLIDPAIKTVSAGLVNCSCYASCCVIHFFHDESYAVFCVEGSTMQRLLRYYFIVTS